MAYEYPTEAGALLIARHHRRWTLEFEGKRRGRWRSPATAAFAASRHRSGLVAWDTCPIDVPDDLLDWRPLGESL